MEAERLLKVYVSPKSREIFYAQSIKALELFAFNGVEESLG